MNTQISILTLNLFLRPPPIKTNQDDYKNERTKYFCKNILPNYDIIALQVYLIIILIKGSI